LGAWAAQLAADSSIAGIDPRFALSAHLDRLAALGPYGGGGH
jgi:sarcosine oxidase